MSSQITPAFLPPSVMTSNENETPTVVDRPQPEPRTSISSRIGAALAVWSRRRGDQVDSLIDEFSDMMAEAADPVAIDTALTRLAHQVAGPRARQVELWRDSGFGSRCVSAWPPCQNLTEDVESTGSTTIDLPLRCGGKERGKLRIVLRGSAAIEPDQHRRLTTLGVLAAASGFVQTEVAEAKVQTNHDAATGFPNAAFFQTFLTYALAMADRRQEPLSVIYVGIDRLAAIRDMFGIETANEAVRRVGRTMAGMLRSSDLVARLDDGRLVAVLPGASAENAALVAETLRSTIEGVGAATPSMPILTATLGLATYPEHADTHASLRSCAAAALADARSKGRNCVSVAPALTDKSAPGVLRIARYAC